MGDYENTKTTIVTTVSSFGVERAAGKMAGVIVQPAVWVMSNTSPDAADTFIYAVGLTGIGTVPAAITGLFKSYIDDITVNRVVEAAKEEPEWARPFIKPVGDFNAWAGDNHNSAMQVATYGYVAWRHSNGAWCFIHSFDREGKRRPVVDYRPQSYTSFYAPKLPLQRDPRGNFKWDAHYNR